MKTKTIWLLIAFLAFSSVSQAEPVDKEAAQVKAAQVLNNRKDANARRKVAVADTRLPKLLKTSISDVGEHPVSDTSAEAPTYYIFGTDDDAGFAIIAGDDAVNSLVGYSQSGCFSADDMPDAMRVWLSDYDRYVKAVRSGSQKARSKAGAQEPAMPVVGPWLKTTWNQYGLLTPNNYPAGCVPTAVAQIMYYYQWPKNSYNRIYDWERMAVPFPENNSYSYLYNPDAQPIAVLMRDLGYMMGTNYGRNGSSTTIKSDTGLTVCGYETEEVKGDLQPFIAQGPVYVSLSGHGVVADGYDSNGLYHINWGWEGINDGYYDVTTTMETENGNYTLASQGHYFLKPVKDKPVVAPIASSIAIDKAEAASGDQINVTLSGLKLASEGNFSGKIALAVYKIMQNGNYFQTMLSFSDATTDTRYRLDSETDWSSTSGVTSLTVSMTLKSLSSRGNFYLVPVCYNELDEKPEWRPLAQYADGTTQEYISFSHQNGQYTFMPFVENNLKLEFLDILTSGSYVSGGLCETYFSIKHFNKDPFLASIDITLSKQGGGEVHVYPQAISFQSCPFDNEIEPTILGIRRDLKLDVEPGEYRISKIELYNGEGDRRKVLCSWTGGTPYFTVEAPTGKPSPELIGRAHNEVDLTGAFSDKSIYEGAQGKMEIVLEAKDGSTPEVELVLWAISADSGERYLLKTETRTLPIGEYHDCYDGTPYSQPFYSDFYYLADVPAGTYTFCLYARCGNNTYILGSDGSAIFHVVAPPANIPKLRLNSLRQEGDFYVGNKGIFNIAIAEIENLGQTDYIGDGLTATDGCGLILTSLAPFRVRAGQKATVFLQVTSYEKEQVETMILNEINIPISSTLKFDFKAAPEHTVSQYVVTPYITYVTTGTYPIFPSATGTLKRSLWQNGKLVKTLDDLTLDGSNKSVLSRQDQLDALPAGEYVAKCELTDANGITCTPLYYPVLIDEERSSLSVTKTALDKRQSSSYDTDIPFLVTFTNNMNKPLSTVIKTEVECESYYTASTRYHSVEISAETSQTLSLVTKIGNDGEPGQYTINARFCDNIRDNGHLQFGRYSSSRYAEPFTLPFTVSNLLGDADGDGSLTPADIIAIWGIISEQSGAPEKGSPLWKNADANGDNVVNAADIVTIVNILQKK